MDRYSNSTTTNTGSKLETWDFVAVALYFAAVLGAGLYSMCRSNRGTVSGYFLAGRYMIWLPVGASLFASNIGSEHFIGLAGSGAAAGVAVGAFELNACILLQLLGWVFLPVYIASGVCTLPEYMKKRFGGRRIRIYLATLSLILYIFTKVSVNLYAGALFIHQALRWNLYLSVLLLLAVTAFVTITGGLAAVIYTDTIQAFVMVIGAFTLMIISFVKVGGYKALYYGYMNAVADSVVNLTLHNQTSTCGYPKKDSWIMLRDPMSPDMPWPGFLFGQTPASIWYWCADQMMVQRALAAKSLSHAQGGTLFAGYIKLLPLFLMVIPGMISRVLFTNEVACADRESCMQACQNPVSCTNIAYPKLVLEVMPTFLRGVMLSVMLAALMSDLTSIFNSASTLFTMDIYTRIREKASVRELMIVGRAFVLIMVAIGILWIPIIQSMQGGQLFIYIQAISAYLAPPIAAVYLIAILWKRGNEKGAFYGLLIGFIIGVIRMILDFIYREPACWEEDTRPSIIAKVHYMYFATILFWITGTVMVVISLLTKPPDQEQLVRTTYWTRHEEIQNQNTLSEEEHFSTVNAEDEETVLSDDASKAVNDRQAERKIAQGSNGTNLLNKTSEKAKKSIYRKTLNWFCGFDDTYEAMIRERAQKERIDKITSLQQNKQARLLLLVFLAILIFVAVFLYAFFTAGSSFGLL